MLIPTALENGWEYSADGATHLGPNDDDARAWLARWAKLVFASTSGLKTEKTQLTFALEAA